MKGIRIKNSEKLYKVDDWLLTLLMNGQVRVGEVAKEYQIKEEVLNMAAEPKEK